MKLREYWPNYFDMGREPEEVEFNSLDELMSIDFVKRMLDTHKDDPTAKFEIAYETKSYLPFQGTLMLSLKDGYEWWVRGFIRGTVEEIQSLGLLEWTAKELEQDKKK